MKAIVYTSNTGTTAEYAKLIGEKTGLPVYSLDNARKQLAPGAEIIYLGWTMASGIKGYKMAAKKFRIRAVCAVGMGGTGTQQQEIRQKNSIPAELPLFTLQGGFDINKLQGIYKLMMSAMAKTFGKGLANKQDRTPDEEQMLEMMLHGGNYVSPENLQSLFEWFEKKQGEPALN